jgi:formyltetrahydrofolate-dependent phosphoribosylglycinamide formyltransferase
VTSRIAVLASGGGSNLQAILEYFDQLGDRRAGEVVAVASDRQSAGALARARSRGIAAVELENPARTGGMPLARVLAEHSIDLVVLAGYLRLVPVDVVRRYDGRMINVHPALLPGFGGPGMYGLRVHQAVLDAGARVSGVTVHQVSEEFDRGAIIAQWPVPVLSGDDAHSLAARVLRVEHVLFPRIINAVAAGRITAARPLGGAGGPAAGTHFAFTLSPRGDECLVADVERLING